MGILPKYGAFKGIHSINITKADYLSAQSNACSVCTEQGFGLPWAIGRHNLLILSGGRKKSQSTFCAAVRIYVKQGFKFQKDDEKPTTLSYTRKS